MLRDSSGGPGGLFDGAYTRLVITATVASGGSGNGPRLAYRPRDAFSRFFVGKHSSLNMTARVTAGGFQATVPLVTIEHVSNNADGEGFSRLVTHSAQNFPLFLVPQGGGGTVVSVRFGVKASDQMSSSAAGTALAVAQNVTRIVAPESAVLTALTQQTVQNTAAALDQAISKLFAMNVGEEHTVEQDIGRWQQGGSVSGGLTIPADEGSWTDTPSQTIGTWSVGFEAPRPSIFSEVRICLDRTAGDNRCRLPGEAATAAYASVNPSTVLSFPLIGMQGTTQSLGTVSAYLRQRDWFTAALNQFRTDTGPVAISQFCRSIRTAMTDIGLNGLDGDIVVMAVAEAMTLPGPVVSGMRANRDCARRGGGQSRASRT